METSYNQPSSHSPPSPYPLASRLDLIEMLNEAAEVEHMLALQYIYAATSLKTHADEFSNEERKWHQMQLVNEWKNTLQSIYREEMQHLHIVNQILVAVGGEPHFGRPNFPIGYYYKKVGDTNGATPMVLAMFNNETLKRFIEFESPEPDNSEIFEDSVSRPVFYQSLAKLYSDIREALTENMLKLGKMDVDNQFPESNDDEIASFRDPRRQIPKITDLASAQNALKTVIEQGEGGSINDPTCHYQRFISMQRDLKAEQKADIHFQPAKNVISNPQLRHHRENVEGVFLPNTTSDDKERAKSDLLNWRCAHQITKEDVIPWTFLDLQVGSYEFLVVWLRQIYAGKRGVHNARERKAIKNLAFFPYMTEVILQLSELTTEIALPINDKNPEVVFLGPSFEITSAGMSFPSPHALYEIQGERLSTMKQGVQKLIKACEELDEVTFKRREYVVKKLKYIEDTFRLLGQEFIYSSSPPSPQPQPGDPLLKYSEDAKQFDPDVDMVTYLKLDFEGWAQCRLPTDPDSSNEKRGVGGNSFAYTDEADLDRIIRFQPEGTVHRLALPNGLAIGVTVRKAVIHTPAGENDAPLEFIGANVNLLDAPEFQGRNHIVADDAAEIIDLFHLQIKAGNKVLLDREVLKDVKRPRLIDLSARERAWSGRAPVWLKMAPNVNLYNIGRRDLIGNQKQYWVERINLLESHLEQSVEFDAKAVAIKARLKYIKYNLDLPRSIMNLRMSFLEHYRHTISGTISGDAYLPENQSFQILESKWLVTYDLGFFDTDASSFYVKGTLYVPICLKKKDLY